jgi:hypothetical protein
MQVPEEFKRLTQCFWQGSDREAANEIDWIARALRLNTPQQRGVIKKFLTQLLASNAEVPELQRAWKSGSPGYAIHDEHIRSFFEQISAAIDD